MLVAHYSECFRFAVGVHCCMMLFAGRISIWQVIVRVVMITEEKLLCYPKANCPIRQFGRTNEYRPTIPANREPLHGSR